MDVNALLGHWPFRKIRKHSLQDLKQVHADNHISGGYVASINSIFYNDPFEGDQELHETLRGSSEYKHLLTVNPTLPGWEKDIEEGIQRFNIKGVRIYPTYHDYNLNEESVVKLCDKLRRHELPLFLTVRMEDERLEYVLKTKSLDFAVVKQFLGKQSDLNVILLNIRFREVLSIKEEINQISRLFIDTSGLKDRVFVIQELCKHISLSKILYGSEHPLYTLKSSFVLVELADIDDSDKRRIFSENARLLNK